MKLEKILLHDGELFSTPAYHFGVTLMSDGIEYVVIKNIDGILENVPIDKIKFIERHQLLNPSKEQFMCHKNLNKEHGHFRRGVIYDNIDRGSNSYITLVDGKGGKRSFRRNYKWFTEITP